MHIKLVSFLRLIVSSCIAELDLFRLTCRTLIFLFCVKVSENEREGEEMIVGKMLDLDAVKALQTLRI